MTDEVLAEEWARVIAEMFPGKPEQDLTPADWAKVEAEGPEMAVVPF